MIKNIILIGSGSHTNKRILPSLKKTNLKILNILKKKKIFSRLNLLPINNYNTISYICTPPKTHFKLINFLLDKKSNVIVEKPALLNKKQFLIIEKKLSKNKKVIFLENIMYLYSKALKKLQIYWLKNNNQIKDIEMNFMIPEFFKIGFRKSAKDKFLILHDIGIYPISLINYLKINMIKIKNINKKFSGTRLKTLKIKMKSQKINLNINIGDSKNYKNNIILINNNGTKIIFDKIFSGIKIKKKITFINKSKVKNFSLIKDHDCFKTFLSMSLKKFKSMKKDNLNMIKNNIYLFDKIKLKINSN